METLLINVTDHATPQEAKDFTNWLGKAGHKVKLITGRNGAFLMPWERQKINTLWRQCVKDSRWDYLKREG